MNRGSAGASIGPVRRAADFERVLRTRPRALSAHFAVHHFAAASAATFSQSKGAAPPKLSTDEAPLPGVPVDDSAADRPGHAFGGPRLRFGAVVPKRHARRAVTRTLMKRQMRAAFEARADRLASGIWLLRLRAGYDRALYPSAASLALRRAVRGELDRLLAGCAAAAPTPA